MSLRRALAAAAADLYHQAWRLLMLNTLLGVTLVAVALSSLMFRPAIVLAVLLGPVAAAVMHCIVTLAQTADLKLVEVFTGLRRQWRRGLVLGALVVAGVLLGTRAVPFYAGAGTWTWPLAALSAYLLAVFTVVQLALWPLAAFESARPLQDLIREALCIVARRPSGFVALTLLLLIVNVVGIAAAVVPFLTVTIAYSFLVSAHFALPENPAREA